MNNFSDNYKQDLIFFDSSGSTTLRYAWPLYDMSGYAQADFIINAFKLSAGTATGKHSIVQAQVYTATAATSTTLTALSSATASFGNTASSKLALVGAQRLYIDFETPSSASTFSICGQQYTVQDANNASAFEVLASSSVGGTVASSNFATVFLSTKNTQYLKYTASTDYVVGATGLATGIVIISPKDPGSTTLSATAIHGATANKGILLYGDFAAHIGVPADKLGGARYVTIGVKSSDIKVPVSVNLLRSVSRFSPSAQPGLAVDVNLGTTTT